MRRKLAKTVTDRGQAKPAKDLSRFIDLVNAEWPFERELPDLYAGSWNAAYETWLKDPSISIAESWAKSCAEAIATLSPETRAFLGPPANLDAFLSRYEQLKSAREVLLIIATRYGCGSRTNLPGVDRPLWVPVNLKLSEHGEFVLSSNAVLDTLIGVRADRIRSCAICGRIFWAPRANSECCGERCRKTYNQRCSRENRRLRKRKGR